VTHEQIGQDIAMRCAVCESRHFAVIGRFLRWALGIGQHGHFYGGECGCSFILAGKALARLVESSLLTTQNFRRRRIIMSYHIFSNGRIFSRASLSSRNSRREVIANKFIVLLSGA